MDTAALVDRMVDSYNRHDTDALAACYAPDARVHHAGWPEDVDAQTWLVLFGGPLLTTFLTSRSVLATWPLTTGWRYWRPG